MQARAISIKSVGVSRSYPALFHGLLVISSHNFLSSCVSVDHLWHSVCSDSLLKSATLVCIAQFIHPKISRTLDRSMMLAIPVKLHRS